MECRIVLPQNSDMKARKNNNQSKLSDLIVRSGNKELTAQDELYKLLLKIGMEEYRHQCKGWLIPSEEAEDIVAAKSWALMQANLHLKPVYTHWYYVRKSFRNAFIDEKRKLSRWDWHEPATYRNEEDEEQHDSKEILEAEVSYLADAMMRYKELEATVLAGIKSLPGMARDVVYLALIRGLKAVEIMEALNLSRSQVDQAYSRGMKRLRDYLRERGFGPDNREKE